MSRPKIVKATRSEKKAHKGKNPLYGKLFSDGKEFDIEAVAKGGCIRLNVKAPVGFYFSDEAVRPYLCTGLDEVSRRVSKLAKCL